MRVPFLPRSKKSRTWRYASCESSIRQLKPHRPLADIRFRGASMTGWTRRRSSGEIINATLLEVFLALVFMVFALAIFEQRRADAAVASLSSAVTPEQADSLRKALAATKDSLETARRVARARAESLSVTSK